MLDLLISYIVINRFSFQCNTGIVYFLLMLSMFHNCMQIWPELSISVNCLASCRSCIFVVLIVSIKIVFSNSFLVIYPVKNRNSITGGLWKTEVGISVVLDVVVGIFNVS